ncbi:MAG: DUF3553 domain-containing protein [Planctomycetota bacterium]|nr:MAG: DUF3553 domain-containing protein [Planctomycetota bacterium]
MFVGRRRFRQRSVAGACDLSDFVIGPELVGRTVRNAARPEWGAGKVLKVQRCTQNGVTAHRVTIHFPIGTRVLVTPPARLAAPVDEPQRAAGWIESLGKSTLDDRLRRVRPELLDVLGPPRERIAALLPLFEYTDDAKSLARWACDQVDVADPLTHWNRDELLAAFREFCVERDSHFRNLAAVLARSEGVAEVRRLLAEAPAPLAERAKAALQRII